MTRPTTMYTRPDTLSPHPTRSRSCQPASAKPGATPQSAAGPLAKLVRRAVDLDNETGDVAVEISDERTRRVLPSEFEATGPLPKRQPQDNFGRRHRLPQRLAARATIPTALKHHPIFPCKGRSQHAVMTEACTPRGGTTGEGLGREKGGRY